MSFGREELFKCDVQSMNGMKCRFSWWPKIKGRITAKKKCFFCIRNEWMKLSDRLWESEWQMNNRVKESNTSLDFRKRCIQYLANNSSVSQLIRRGEIFIININLILYWISNFEKLLSKFINLWFLFKIKLYVYDYI